MEAMENEKLVKIRLSLDKQEVETFERIRQFLGLRSLSATVARCALWNASAISAALDASPQQETSRLLEGVAPMVDGMVKALARQMTLQV